MLKSGFIDLTKYKKQNKIGEGGFGIVYIVSNKETNEKYACKISLKEVDQDSKKDLLNISREVNIISKLQHPCVLKFIGYSPIDFDKSPKPVIITELSSNGSLSKVLDLERRSLAISGWDDTKKLIVIYGIASGMSYLHSNNVLHRDLKPDNIFLDDYLCPKIADFGLSKINHDKESISTLQSTTGIKGTPIYIAPEVWEDQEYTKAGDVYAFSLIVYEIITGQIPYQKFTLMQIIQKVINQKYRPEFKSKIPKSYRKLIERCWEHDPKKRLTFDQIVENLKKDRGFITELVEEGDYIDYIEYLEQAQISFKSSKKIIHLSEIVNMTSKTFKKVTISQDKSTSSTSEENTKSKFSFPEKIFNKLNKMNQKLVTESKDDFEKQFQIGKNLFEGINGFPKNPELSFKYLKSSTKGGFIEAAIYYSRILLEGKTVPENPEKVAKYLNTFLTKKNSTVYYLYAIAMKKKKNYSEAIKYLNKACNIGNAEAMHEYGMMLLKGEGIKKDEKQAKHYFEMAKMNGYKNGPIIQSKNTYQPKIVDLNTFQNLNEECQKKIIEAENGNKKMIIQISNNFIEGTFNYPKNPEIGQKLLEYGIEKLNDESVLIFYIKLVQNKKVNLVNFNSKIKYLNDIATNIKSGESKYQLGKLILSNQSFDLDSTNDDINYVFAKELFKQSRKLGHVKAETEYGKICMKEKKNKFGEIKRNFSESYKSFQNSSSKGDAEGMAFYGLFLEFGYGCVRVDYEEASKLYKKSYEKGDLSGCALYGSSLIDKKFHILNEQEGVRLIKYSAERNNPIGLNKLGFVLYNGLAGFKKSSYRSFEYFKKASFLGYSGSLCNISYFYRSGECVDKNIPLSMKLLNRAIEEGSVRGIYILGDLYYNGNFGINKNKFEGAKLLQIAADIGDSNAIYDYSLILIKGDENIKPNPNKLRYYLDLGVKIKNTSLIRLYGSLYLNGNFFPLDIEKGINYWKMAIELGDKETMESYAELLSKGGNGIKKNPILAMKYREMAKKVESDNIDDYNKPKLINISLFNSLKDSCKQLVLSAEKGDHLALSKVFKGFFNGINCFPLNREIGEVYLKHGIQDLLEEQILINVFKNQLKSYLDFGIDNKVTYCMRMYRSLLFSGQIFNKNEAEGVKYYKMAADLGNVGAMKDYASIIEKGSDHVAKNLEEARKYREMASKT